MVRFRIKNMKRQILIVYLVALCLVKCMAMSNTELQDFKNFLDKTSALDQTLKDGFNSEEDEDEDVSDHAWEESGKFEGDLILSDRQRKIIVADVAEGLSRNGLNDITKRWPNNEVIYYIQREHFSGSQVQAIQDGIDDLGRAACITFRPYKKGDRDAVVIQGSRRGCFSQVGYQGGYQVLNLSGRHPVGRGCFRHGTVVHELLHTLGFYHMQSSPDRDEHIDVVWENIVEPAKHNFRKYNSFAVTDFGVGYDYDSVLHYSKRAFSINGKDTLVPKQSGAEIGQRIGLSDKDTQKLNKMYCDKDSNNFEQSEEIATQRPVKKKTSRNKPFKGHGIGYHKGKTVVIKLPAAETYKLPDLPSYHIFDYFSKAPQTLSIGYPETFSKEVDTYEYPYKETFKKIDDESKAIEKQNDKGTSSDDVAPKKEENIEEMVKDNKNKNVKVPKPDSQKETTSKEKPIQSETALDESLKDAFERLRKIIKTHVYPTRGVDFNPYEDDEKTSLQKDDRSTTKKQKEPGYSKFSSIIPTGFKIYGKTESTPFINDVEIPNSKENSKSDEHKDTSSKSYYSDEYITKKPHPYSPYIHDVEIPHSTENSKSDENEDNSSKSYYSDDYITKNPQPYSPYIHDVAIPHSTENSKSDEHKDTSSKSSYSDDYITKKPQPFSTYIHDVAIPHSTENSKSDEHEDSSSKSYYSDDYITKNPQPFSTYIHDVEIPHSTENSKSDKHKDTNIKSYYSDDYITKKPQPYLPYIHDVDNAHSTENSKNDKPKDISSKSYYSDDYITKKSQPYLNYEDSSGDKVSSKYVFPIYKKHSDYLNDSEYDSFGEYRNKPQKRNENPFKDYYIGSYGSYKHVPKTWLSK